MAWTLVAFDDDNDVARTTLTAVEGEADDHVRVVDEDIYVPELNKLIGAYALCKGAGHDTGASQAQLSSPSLRKVALFDLSRIDKVVAKENAMVGLTAFPQNPLTLETNEALNGLMLVGAMGDTRSIIGVFLADGPITPVRGEIHTVRCTTEVAGTLGEWTSGNITFGQDLPVGRYQLVGGTSWLGGAFGLFRFIPVGGRWRPGGMLKISNACQEPALFRNGNMGVWMEFNQLTPPRIEILTTDTQTNPVLWLDLIKIA